MVLDPREAEVSRLRGPGTAELRKDESGQTRSSFEESSVTRAQKATQTQGSHIRVPGPSIRGIPENMVGRLLMFMWAFGARVTPLT